MLVINAKVNLISPTILYILTIQPYFLTFAHYLLFHITFFLSFVCGLKKISYFCKKANNLSNEKKEKDILHLIIYSRIHQLLANASAGTRQHQIRREATLG